MRIIAGSYKGRRLNTVERKTTRPTTSRAREAWASTLATLTAQESFLGLRVLDAFAGSGALGLELLSRGAEMCVFVEQDKRALETLKENIALLALSGTQAKVCLADSFSSRHIGNIRQWAPYHIVVLDPPYHFASRKVCDLLTQLSRAGLLAHQSVISYEHTNTSGESLEKLFPEALLPFTQLELVRKKTYGSTTIDYFRYSQHHKMLS